jgi:uncharacterized membrane protein HdeD (DUF308 family)
MVTMTAADREAALAISRHWPLRLAVGALFLVLGFVVFGYDERSLTVVSVFVGVSFLMTAFTWLVVGILADELKGFWIVAALLAAGAGITALVYPDETLKVLSLLLGWMLLLGGIVHSLLAATDRTREGWWLGLAFGILQFGIGAWAVSEADRSLALLTTLVGVYCVLKGAYELITALQLRSLRRDASAHSPVT